MALDVGFKRLLPGLRFDGGGFVSEGIFPALLPAIVHGQAVFSLYLPAKPISRGIVPKRLMPGVPLRVNHVVGNMHVNIIGVLVDAAMPLMLGKSESGGKAFLDSFECFRRKLGFILRAEADE